MTDDRTRGTSPPPAQPPEADPNSEARVGLWGKLLLTAFPFLLVLLFLLVEWWIRGRS